MLTFFYFIKCVRLNLTQPQSFLMECSLTSYFQTYPIGLLLTLVDFLALGFYFPLPVVMNHRESFTNWFVSFGSFISASVATIGNLK